MVAGLLLTGCAGKTIDKTVTAVTVTTLTSTTVVPVSGVLLDVQNIQSTKYDYREWTLQVVEIGELHIETIPANAIDYIYIGSNPQVLNADGDVILSPCTVIIKMDIQPHTVYSIKATFTPDGINPTAPQ